MSEENKIGVYVSDTGGVTWFAVLRDRKGTLDTYSTYYSDVRCDPETIGTPAAGVLSPVTGLSAPGIPVEPPTIAEPIKLTATLLGSGPLVADSTLSNAYAVMFRVYNSGATTLQVSGMPLPPGRTREFNAVAGSTLGDVTIAIENAPGIDPATGLPAENSYYTQVTETQTLVSLGG